MIATEHQPLWKRIEQYQIDDPVASVKFSDKLALYQQWSPLFTTRAIQEYKRFIFLCCISPTGASPPPIVDEVWHLHLTYTQDYWKVFCNQVLQQEIHHFPSKGGPAEKQKHNDWYTETLVLYAAVFDEEPPADIWIKPQPAITGTDWSLSTDPPKLSYHHYLWFLLFPLLIPFTHGQVSPFGLTGGEFLVFYGLLILAGFACCIPVYQDHAQRARWILDNYMPPDTTIYQVARYFHGHIRSVQTAIVDLYAQKILEPLPKRNFIFRPSHYAYTYTDQETNPLLYTLRKKYEEGETLHYATISQAYDSTMTQDDRLEEAYKISIVKDYWRWLPAALIICTGIARVIQGLVNHKPVDYLVLMLVVGGFFLIVIYQIINPRAILKKELEERYKADRLPQNFSPHSVIFQFAFIGMAALTTSHLFDQLRASFYTTPLGNAGDATYTTSCGGSGGGSSCSGGGDGGCGGCGGD